MITDYHCRHCKSKCPPFKFRSANDRKYKRYTTTCPHCRTKYRIAGDSPVVEEVRKPRFESGGFTVNDENYFVLPDAPEFIIPAKNGNAIPLAAGIEDAVFKAARAALLCSLLKRAEQLEQYERCAELRDKINDLGKQQF